MSVIPDQPVTLTAKPSQAVDSRPPLDAATPARSCVPPRRRCSTNGDCSPRRARELARVPDESVPSLAALAHEVRLAWCGPEVEVEGILSVKTGGCPEDCHFCSQSSHSTRR